MYYLEVNILTVGNGEIEDIIEVDNPTDYDELIDMITEQCILYCSNNGYSYVSWCAYPGVWDKFTELVLS